MIRVVLLVAALLAACSSVETASNKSALQALEQDRIQLRVRTGNERMDQLVYELAYQQFSNVIPLKEQGPYTGSMEITFASTTSGTFIGTSSSFGSGDVTGWYTGNHFGASGSGYSTTLQTGGFMEWQNSTMVAVLRRGDDRLWSADYNYKGGWEMSGYTVNTPDEAARLILKRLRERFEKDRKA